MALRRQYEKPARVLYCLFIGFVVGFDLSANFSMIALWIGCNRLHNLKLDITTQLNVGTPASHVGGDCHRAQFSGISNDLRFLLVLAGV